MVYADSAPAAARRGVSLAGTRLRRNGRSLLLAAAAASVSYAVAVALLGRAEAFFAPIAAVICVGVTAGQRIRRAGEIAFGVAVGLSAADLLLRVMGAGALQISAVVLVAMGITVALGAGPLVANQAAVAALLVVVLGPTGAPPYARFVDALVGGGVALTLNAVFTAHPERAARHAAREVFGALTGVLDSAATALAEGSLATAERAVADARSVEGALGDLDTALDAAREAARLSVVRRRALREVSPLLAARGRLDLLAAGARSLARAAANAARRGRPASPDLVASVAELRDALRHLERFLVGEETTLPARTAALRAAARGSAVLAGPHDLTTSVLVGHVRSAVVDVLRACGLDQRSAVEELERAAGRADQIG